MGEWNAPHVKFLDDQIMPLVDMCNIACGAHAGSLVLMKYTVDLAKKHNVLIGAHPGYNDRENFGRVYNKMKPEELYDLINEQIDSLNSICNIMNADLYHIKPHGALYHACNNNEEESEVLCDVISQNWNKNTLVCAPGSLLMKKAQQKGIRVLKETFIDRRYENDLSLVSRTKENAVITELEEAIDQYESLKKGFLTTVDDTKAKIISETCCIHGDNPEVLNILKAIC